MSTAISDIRNDISHLSGNPVWVTGSTTAKIGTFYQILLRVTSLDGNLLGGPFIDAIAPDGSFTVYFNISGIVNQPAEYWTTFVSYPGEIYIEHTHLAFSISLEAGESYFDTNGDRQENWSGTTTNIIILRGGLGSYTLMAYGVNQTNFHEMWIDAKRFLSWQPLSKSVSPNVKSKLYYLDNGVNTPTKIRTVAYYQGNLGDPTIAYRDITITQNKLYELTVDPATLSIPLTDGGNLAYYDVCLSNAAGGNKTEIRRFIVDHNYYEQETFVYYANSIGGIDTLWCTGKSTQLYETVTETSKRPLQRIPASLVETTIISNKSGQRKWNINTGFKSKTELLSLVDFLLAKKMWLVVDGSLVPVYIQDEEKSLQDITGDITVDQLSFVLFEAHSNTYF